MRTTALILAIVLVATGAAAHDLKVATWNIEHLRDGIGERGNLPPYRDHRLNSPSGALLVLV